MFGNQDDNVNYEQKEGEVITPIETPSDEVGYSDHGRFLYLARIEFQDRKFTGSGHSFGSARADLIAKLRYYLANDFWGEFPHTNRHDPRAIEERYAIGQQIYHWLRIWG